MLAGAGERRANCSIEIESSWTRARRSSESAGVGVGPAERAGFSRSTVDRSGDRNCDGASS